MSFYAFLFLAVIATSGAQDYEYDYEETPAATSTREPIKLANFLAEATVLKQEIGSSATFSCESDDPNVVLLIQKEKKNGQQTVMFADGTKITRDDRYSYDAAAASFTVNDIRESDAAKYSCLHQYNDGSMDKLTHELDVLLKPKIRGNEPTTKTKASGTSVQLHCRASGNPLPTITWTKEGSDEIVYTGAPLRFTQVTRLHGGVYICHASNGVGTPDQAIRRLEIKYKPEVTAVQEEYNTGEGDKVELQCLVHAHPAGEVKWYKDGSPLSEDTQADVDEADAHRHTYTLAEVTTADLGVYTCEARNELGNDSVEIVLTDEPGDASIKSFEQVGDENKFEVMWTTSSYYPIESYFYKYKATDSEDDATEVTIKEVEEVSSEGSLKTYKFTVENLEFEKDFAGTIIFTNSQSKQKETGFTFSTKKEQTGKHNQTGGSGVTIPSFVTLFFTLALIMRC